VTASKPTTCILDPIPSNLFKELFPVLSSSVLRIINMSLSVGSVPSAFKTAIVKPLLKKQNTDPQILYNYRPISNLPFMSKLLERAVANQITDHLSNNNLFDKFQSGFRSRHSTETALTRVVNDLLITADSDLTSLLLLLDLSAAFDTVDHNILLSRLEKHIGIQGTVLSWFHSYLSNRTQRVYYNNTISTFSVVKSGVPQGSVLGPMLFSIYMLPLGDIICKYDVQFHCYADDTQLYVPVKPKACLLEIKKWMNINFLLLNADKTELLVVRPAKHGHLFENLSVNIDDCIIPESSTIKNLGVIFDSRLTFQPHIKSITKTAFFHLSNIAKIRPILSLRDAETLIHAFVSSRLDYCNVLLSGLPNYAIRSLQLVQNAAARLLTKTRKYDHITPVLASLHWLPVQARADFKVLLLTYKALHGLAPPYLSELLTPYTPARPLRSLDAALLVIPSINKKSLGFRAFAYRAPYLWNTLPLHVLNYFKSRLKTHLYSLFYGLP
ncbi:hypothetical protein LDENG_00075870, partial [Lucifuga dentata]